MEEDEICDTCNGSGEVDCEECAVEITDDECEVCGGSGAIECPDCGGMGTIC